MLNIIIPFFYKKIMFYTDDNNYLHKHQFELFFFIIVCKITLFEIQRG